MDKSIGDYQQRATSFEKYLKDTSKKFFRFLFQDDSHVDIPYKHRWSEQYKKQILAKMYQLDIWAKRQKLDMAMISLTTTQAGLTDYQILENLKASWDLLRQTLSKQHYQYFCLYEPHKSGIAHIHVLLMGEIKDENIEGLRRLWKDKYGMGNENSFYATIDRKEAINSIVNYLMKYMAKTVKGGDSFDEAELRFHSLFWETGKRQWSSTRYLTFVMAMIKKKSEKVCNGLGCIEKTLEGDMIKWEKKVSTFVEDEYLKKCHKKDKTISECVKRANSIVFIPESYAKSVPNIIGTLELRRLEVVDEIITDLNIEVIKFYDGLKKLIKTPSKLEKCKYNDIMGYFVKADDLLVRDVMYSL